ncbi:hypothetical protein [Massilia niabensis]|uniref:Pol beta superfamily nucleotidyltransferase in conflict systems domain-containing protein n=1 Tax=Massilia niabensis TaxID=544910 RepID=A0ABW0L7W4_9BURK
MSTNRPIQKLFEKLKEWSKSTHDAIQTEGVYVFGSLVHNEGAQFNDQSDVDLLIQIPSTKTTPMDRVHWIVDLHNLKSQLEVDLMRLLSRDSRQPIVSIVVASKLDIEANVHKDGAVGFFSENIFYDLLNDISLQGLPAVKTGFQPARLVVECFKFAQKKRNEFLAVSANGSERVKEFDGEDPLPKDVMRYAAMARQLAKPTSIPGADTDTQRGLDYLTRYLYDFETISSEYQELHNAVSVRRGARGTASKISPFQQLLLSEIIVDSAISFNSSAVAAEGSAGIETIAELPKFTSPDSAVFFAERFSQAFPGNRGVQWFDKPDEIQVRLERLLCEPIEFSDTTPIWWWRNGNLQIEKFVRENNGNYLMNNDELRISKIAAVHGGQYYRSFVYVEVDAMSPTGLYPSAEQGISEFKPGTGAFGYYWEEYGLVDGQHLVTRGEYDDGAAVINGILQDISGRTQLRCRYTTPYNFIIAPHNSPINNSHFDHVLEFFLNGILQGDRSLDELAAAVKKLPKRE